MSFYAPKTYTNTIPAGGVLPVPVFGNFLNVAEASAPVEIAFNSGSFEPYKMGQSVLATGEDQFGNVQVRNPGTEAVRFSIKYGLNCEFIDRRQEVLPPRTRIQSREETTIAAGATAALPGKYQANDIRRKSIQVSNTDTTLPVHLVDAAGNVALVIRPLDTITLDISEPVGVKNPNGTAVAAFISEIIFVSS
ncbi:hypothetical protein OpiT1DRAFT_04749 [Opitutaceae bacterium TAV1]|nr:hypothetical protein OpiT1DRAFT_04749 [Opitutaceae bacterium TAV1]